ncbi:MAG: TM2 domain-containing protein [Ruminococcaceae bacterium]|nr:TM2 domain-containing protein [Oscillospiraceae bacterium]
MDHQNPQPYHTQQEPYCEPYQQHSAPPQYNNQTVIVNTGFAQKPKSKWAALALCFFFGFLGAHKFYEEKTGMGILYLFTAGLFGIGVIIDFIVLLFKPSQYTV